MSKVKCSKIIALIRNSLIYNMFIMFLILMLFLQILFLLSPKKGSISYSGPVINTAEIESEAVSICSTMKSVSVELASKDEVFIDWLQLLLIPTGDNPTIFIEATNNQFFYTDIFIPLDEYNGTKKNSPSLIQDSHVTTTYSYFDTYVNSKTGFIFDVEDGVTLKLTFSGIDAYAKNETGEIEKVESFEANDFICTSESILRLFTGYGNEDSSIQKYDISFLNFIKASFEANGDFYVSYTSKENKLSSTMRKIEIESNGQINANMNYSDNVTLNLYGQVTKGTIDGYTIFPTFINWYYDNVFFAPLTLISTLTGGIALMKKRETHK